jgi:DNA-binding transcriptional regulator YiaG
VTSGPKFSIPEHFPFNNPVRFGPGNVKYLVPRCLIRCATKWYIKSRLSSFGNEGKLMNCKEFRSLRQRFQKSQKQLSQLLGTSLKAVQSFEQGWRQVPVAVERQMLFLLYLKRRGSKNIKPCWEMWGCSPQTRDACPAWEFQVGDLCWFINGTICRGKPQDGWSRKMKICRRCEVFASVSYP